ASLRKPTMPATCTRLNATLASRCHGRLRRHVSKRNGQRRSTAFTKGISSRISSALLDSHTHGSQAAVRALSILATRPLNTALRVYSATQKATSTEGRQRWKSRYPPSACSFMLTILRVHGLALPLRLVPGRQRFVPASRDPSPRAGRRVAKGSCWPPTCHGVPP